MHRIDADLLGNGQKDGDEDGDRRDGLHEAADDEEDQVDQEENDDPVLRDREVGRRAAVAEVHPDLTGEVVAHVAMGGAALSSTMAWLDETSQALIAYWVELLRDEDWETFFSSTTNLFWTEQRAAMLEPFKRLLVRLARPGDKDRLLVILQQLLEFDHRALLSEIEMPTLVTGGLEDEIFAPELQLAMAARIGNVQTIMQPGFGHGNDLENPAHTRLLAAFGRLHIPRQELLLGDPRVGAVASAAGEAFPS